MEKSSKTKRRPSISLSLDWDKIFNKGMPPRTVGLDPELSHNVTSVNFCTGSCYSGQWNLFGMGGRGTYFYPYQCDYHGEFEDGMFHGKGTLTYPMGQRLACFWDKGKLISYKFVFTDGTEQDNTYCQMPDRRFMIEIREGLQPAGREFQTNQPKARTVPEDCYDTGDGFFSWKNQCILSAREADEFQENLEYEEHRRSDELNALFEDLPDTNSTFWVNTLTVVPPKRGGWIKKHCRKAWDEPVGLRKDFYRDWVSGRWSELEILEEKYKCIENLGPEITQEEEKTPSTRASAMIVTPTTVYAGTGRKLIPGSKLELYLSESANFMDMYR